MIGASVAMCAIAMEHGLAGPKKRDRKPIRGSTKERKVVPVAEANKERKIDYQA